MPQVTTPSVADLVREGTNLVRQYAAPHRRDGIPRRLAELQVQLREHFEDKQGKPDLRGSSQAYRDAVSQMYADVDMTPTETQNLKAAVRYHVSTVLREHLAARAETDLSYYGLSPEDSRSKARTSQQWRAQLAANAQAADIDPSDPGSIVRRIAKIHSDVAQITADPEALRSVGRVDPRGRSELLTHLEDVEEAVDLLRRLLP